MTRIGVDVGGTTITAAAIAAGVVERSVEVDTPGDRGPEAVLDGIASAVGELGMRSEQVGVGIPGQLDEQGKCYRLPNVPGFEGVAIARELESRIGARVFAENDATCAALAELVYGVGASYPSFLLATLGTGVGGGLVLHGELHRGARGFAAEIGHVMIDSAPTAWRCACGQIGCVEATAGTAGLLRSYRERSGKSVERVLEIADAAHAGDSAALITFETMGRALGKALVAIQNVLDLDAIVFAGGIAAAHDLFGPTVRRTLRERAFGAPVAEVPLLVSELGSRAGVLGAAALPDHAKR